MNHIRKTLLAAHDQQFLVGVGIGSRHYGDGWVKEVDDETVIIEMVPLFGGGDIVIALGSISYVYPYPNSRRTEETK